ncbi:MAG TPA: hypothetical protein VFH95_05265 [Candidatus Kapabacteria bacterium]|nr:hypothetical protein [Candidatus Kapabacteria bacterium]
MKTILIILVALVVVVALGLFLFWRSLFPNTYHYRNLTLHYQTKDASDTSELLLAARKLESSVVFDSAKSYNIYLCPSQSSFRMLAPVSPGANATIYESMNAVFLRPLPYPIEQGTKLPRRMSTMAGLIATTITRNGLHDDSLASNAASWKSIGYSEYIGADSLQNIRSICQSDTTINEPPALLESIKDQLAVTYLMQVERIGFDSIISGQIPRDSILKIICESSGVPEP